MSLVETWSCVEQRLECAASACADLPTSHSHELHDVRGDSGELGGDEAHSANPTLQQAA